MRTFLKIFLTALLVVAALVVLAFLVLKYSTKAESDVSAFHYANESNASYEPAKKGSTLFPLKKKTSKKGSHSVPDFEQIYQMPELPTGCEVTSLTMVLNYLGADIDKVSIAREYLLKADVTFNEEDDKYYGPDFVNIFAGDPEGDSSYGCMAPCIVRTAQRYIKETEYVLSPVNLTGSELDELLDYIDHDMPVIVWTTMDLIEPVYKAKWNTPEGEEVVWPTNEHCVVLTGYDADANTVTTNDPMYGVLFLDMDAFRERYDQLGQNAVIIIKGNNQ